MIGFGELRKLSVQWRMDIAAVERAYVIDWLLKGIFDHAVLARILVLRASAALRYAYFADYPIGDDPEFWSIEPLDSAAPDVVTHALDAAATASGLKFSVGAFTRGSAKVEYTGPLGRRSAAQPRVSLSFVAGQTRHEPARVSLVHPFSDACAATVAAVALEELAAERMAALAGAPRAREVFDLWFVLTHARERIDRARTLALAAEIAQAKNGARLRADTPFDSAHRAALERTWDSALRRVASRPAFAQVEHDGGAWLRNLVSD
ncbi:MAG: nucleotidyl transferase AbiEii/AbiGii toxin family protein [Chloroflexota bacterium]|nr:nucleotidyl transferase AbiEii/AbiGii toxin family protein [Chloroflexota bacterium]